MVVETKKTSQSVTQVHFSHPLFPEAFPPVKYKYDVYNSARLLSVLSPWASAWVHLW